MIPPEPDPPEPGPDPPTPTPTYNDWEYLSTRSFYGNPLYVDVGSASDAFVGVVTVGLNSDTAIPGGWYSDGSLLKIGTKYYPCRAEDLQYYDYDTRRLMQLDVSEDTWEVIVYNASVFDQVPADFISYLQSGNFTLVQG